MNRWIVLTSFRPTAEPAEVQSWLAAANVVAVDAPDIIDSSVAENLPGSVSDCDAVWDLLTLEDSPRQILSVQRLDRRWVRGIDGGARARHDHVPI